jgi:hypothetical protein
LFEGGLLIYKPDQIFLNECIEKNNFFIFIQEKKNQVTIEKEAKGY